jgi:hypothetical protein
MITKVVAGAWIIVATAVLSAEARDVRVADGTQVRIKLMQFVSSETSRPGEPVLFEVAEDVRRDADVVIRRHTTVVGIVTDARPYRINRFSWLWWGRPKPGLLVLSATETRAVDGQVIRLRALADENRQISQRRPPLLRWSHEGTFFGAVVDGDYVVRD